MDRGCPCSGWPTVSAPATTTGSTCAAAEPEQRRALAAAASEAAGFTGWLAWDMGDHGSARTGCGRAIDAARASGDPRLTAYFLLGHHVVVHMDSGREVLDQALLDEMSAYT